MTLRIFHVDAFASRLFVGNPAAVVPLSQWPPDDLLQKIALENNLSETAFLVEEPAGIHIRWFTPLVEVDLCGHATLAAAHVLFTRLGWTAETIAFQSRSGPLSVRRKGEHLVLDFPAQPGNPIAVPAHLGPALGVSPSEALTASDLMAVFDSEEQIRQMHPDFAALAELPYRGIVVTAPGREADFVSRFFAPAVGIDEDPVTGSAHTTLTPYWSRRLGKTSLYAQQLSPRGGELWLEDCGARISIAGKAVLYLEGTIAV